MASIIALVGRPNVGKSTLFNVLTGSRRALVADFPGLTRDRQYGEALWHENKLIIIDTGGLVEKPTHMEKAIFDEAEKALFEADLIFFIVDGKSGPMPEDFFIAKRLRSQKNPVLLVVNKMDGQHEFNIHEFQPLGLGEPVAISASHKQGVSDLMDRALGLLAPPSETALEKSVAPEGIKIALFGRPNVGKSTLTNRILGEARVIASDLPGTTRDSIYIPFTRLDKTYTIIDTAGVRRRGKIFETVEKFSVIKTLEAVSACDVAILLIDAQENLTDQDMHLLQYILEQGRALIIAINKWDNLSDEQKNQVKQTIDRRLVFVADFVKFFFISALHGTGVGNLFKAIEQAHRSATKDLSTAALTEVLLKATADHQPPLVQHRRIKLKYAHSGGHNPQVIVLHGNQLDHLPKSYERYLINAFREHFKLVGVPVVLQFKNAKNPFSHIRNKLTPLQQHKAKKKKAAHKSKK